MHECWKLHAVMKGDVTCSIFNRCHLCIILWNQNLNMLLTSVQNTLQSCDNENYQDAMWACSLHVAICETLCVWCTTTNTSRFIFLSNLQSIYTYIYILHLLFIQSVVQTGKSTVYSIQLAAAVTCSRAALAPIGHSVFWRWTVKVTGDNVGFPDSQ